MKKAPLKEIHAEVIGIETGRMTAGRVRTVERMADGSIRRTEVEPAAYRADRARAWEAKSQVAKVRHILDLSQKSFASLLGVSINTLRKWEHGTTAPSGAARTLLILAEKHPAEVKAAAELAAASA